MNFGSFSGREIQNIIAFLSHCENHGVTDIRFVRQRASEYLHRNTDRMTMTPEQRKEALERKRMLRKPEIKKLFETEGHRLMQCPKCEDGTLTEVRREGIIYLACRKHGRYGCGFSEMIGDM